MGHRESYVYSVWVFHRYYVTVIHDNVTVVHKCSKTLDSYKIHEIVNLITGIVIE